MIKITIKEFKKLIHLHYRLKKEMQLKWKDLSKKKQVMKLLSF